MHGRRNKPFTKGLKVVHRRKTAKANAKMKKRITKRRTIVDKTLHRKIKIQHHQPHYETWVDLRCTWRGRSSCPNSGTGCVTLVKS